MSCKTGSIPTPLPPYSPPSPPPTPKPKLQVTELDR